MQNAKDTFFEMLRDRVASADASLTVAVRGTLRTAVLVEENELTSETSTLDCFVLRWTNASLANDGPLPLAHMRCDIAYATAGTGAGMDRGRALNALDTALAQALNTSPQQMQKKDFRALATGGAAIALHSKIWWSDVSFGEATPTDSRLQRVATVEVWSYEEAGEA